MDDQELAQKLGVAFEERPFFIARFAIDSRAVEPGTLFFALPGERVCGEAFLEEVAQKGGIAAIVSKSYAGPDYGLVLIKVDDVVAALQKLARQVRLQLPAHSIAITGSLGKTTTKEFTRSLLQTTFLVDGNPGTQNSQVTFPLALLHANKKAQLLVLEMGMTHKGDIAKLVAIAPPEIAVITNIAYAHACNFANGQEGIAQAKAEIFAHPKTHLGIYNADTPYASLLAKAGECQKVAFSLKDRTSDFYLSYKDGIVEVFEKGVLALSVSWRLPGLHLLPNFLAAYSVARCLNVSVEAIEKGVSSLKLQPRRLQRMEKGGIVFINDAYNASSPDAVIGALKSLPKPAAGGRRIGVLGSMRELGPYMKEAHENVAKQAMESVDELYCLGEESALMQQYWDSHGRLASYFQDRKELFAALRENLTPGDVVLVKGSRALNMDLIIEEWPEA